MNSQSRVLVLGARGMVGSAIVRELKEQGFKNVFAPSKAELDLSQQSAVQDFFQKHKPEFVFMAAAKVGGILANNNYRADFIFQNLLIQNNVFDAAFKLQITKMVFLGSSCIYPRDCPQPIKEDYLLTGPLEATNEPYAIAKIAGLKTAENFRRQYGCRYLSLMPTNLYGPNDNFDKENSHVIPGLIRRMHDAKNLGAAEFKVWGTGKPRREFLFVDDLAKASVFAMKDIEPGDGQDWLNVGTGTDVTIGELAQMIANVVGYEGKILFDTSRPDGTPRKLLDVSKIVALGWTPRIDLAEGLQRAYKSFVQKSGT